MSNRQVKKLKYAFRDGYGFANVNADVAGNELARLTKKHGALTPDVVVEDARPEDAALHPVFEWDDFKAAEAHRRQQARTLIRSVQVVRETDTGEVRQPVYVHVPQATSETEGPGYQLTEVVAQRPDMYAAALGELSRRVTSARDAVEQLELAAQEESADPDRMARIGLAAQALSAAQAAVQALH